MPVTSQTPVFERIRLKMSIEGIPGSGKSRTALHILTTLIARLRELDQLDGNGEIFAGDSEKRSILRHQKRKNGSGYDFKWDEMKKGSPEEYIEFIDHASNEGFSAVLLDSISHEWAGKEGIRAYHDAIVEKKKSQGKKVNDFAEWGPAKKPHLAFIDKFTDPLIPHLICTIRKKLKHKQEGSEIVRLGTRPIQHEEIGYEFDIQCEMNEKHQLRVLKSRFPEIDRVVFDPMGTTDAKNPVENFGVILADLLTDSGTASSITYEVPTTTLPDGMIETIQSQVAELGVSPERWRGVLTKEGVTRIEDLSYESATRITQFLARKIKEHLADEANRKSVSATHEVKESLVPPDVVHVINLLRGRLEIADDTWNPLLQSYGANSVEYLDLDAARRLRDFLTKEVEAKFAPRRPRTDVKEEEKPAAEPPAETPANGQAAEPDRVEIPQSIQNQMAVESFNTIAKMEFIAEDIENYRQAIGIPDDAFQKSLAKRGAKSVGDLSEEQLREFRGALKTLYEKRLEAGQIQPSPLVGGLAPAEVASIVSSPASQSTEEEQKNQEPAKPEEESSKPAEGEMAELVADSGKPGKRVRRPKATT